MTPLTSPVHVLMCEAHIGFGIPCLQSLIKHSVEPFQLIIHSDGSLGSASEERLRVEIPTCKIISRLEADERMGKILAKFAAMAEARKHLPHVLKLLDINFLEDDGPVTRYVDSDVFFFRPFRGLFETAKNMTGAFSCDYNSSFGTKVTDFWPLGPLVLVKRLNSGLFWIRRDVVDYERMEWLFKRWGLKRVLGYGGWFEQTVWADAAWRARCHVYDIAQIRTANEKSGESEGEVGIHFVTPARQHLSALLSSSDQPATLHLEPVTIKTISAKPYTLLNAGLASLQFHWRKNFCK